MTTTLSSSPQMEALKIDWLAQIDTDLRMAGDLIETMAEPGLSSLTETSEAVFRVFHDIQGQAAVFNYALLASVATKFCAYWRPIKSSPAPHNIPVARAHLVAARFILDRRLEGCGGPTGPSIMAKLDAMIGQQS
jgi:hypothetical protein